MEYQGGEGGGRGWGEGARLRCRGGLALAINYDDFRYWYRSLNYRGIGLSGQHLEAQVEQLSPCGTGPGFPKQVGFDVMKLDFFCFEECYKS